MKKALILFVVFIVCIVGVLLVAPSFIDWNRHKGTIIEQVEKETGYQLKIDGPLEMAILPVPKLLIGDLDVRTAKGDVLALKRLDVRVELMPLLKGIVNVQDVTLVNPVVHVGIGKDGKPDFMTDKLSEKLGGDKAKSAVQTEGSADEAGGISQLVSLDSIKVENGTFIYKDARSGTAETVSGINLALKADSLSGPFEAKGDVSYKNHKIDLDVKTGRLETDADSISVSADLGFDGLNSTVNYSGVVGLTGGVDVQGETSVKTANASKLIAAFTGNDVPAIAYPIATAGVLSATDKAIQYNNLSLTLAGQAMNGSVAFTLPQGDKAGNLQIDLTASKAVALDKIIPSLSGSKSAASGAAGKSGGQNNASLIASFMPQSVSLPMNIDGSVKFVAPSVSYQGQQYDQLALSVDKSGKAIGFKASFVPNGGGAAKFDGELAFGSMTRSAQNGSVTLSDPALDYQMNLTAKNPETFLAAYIKQNDMASLQPYLGQGVRVSARGRVTPNNAGITAGAIGLNDTSVDFGGSYVLRGGENGRDLLTANIQADQVDLDKWLGTQEDSKAGASKSPAASSSSKGALDLASYTKMLALPFDLKLTVLDKGLSYNGARYQNAQLKAALHGKALKIDTASISDADGNNALLAGSVDNIETLKNVSLSLSGSTKNLEKLLDTFGVDSKRLPARVGAAELASEFRGQPDNLGFTVNLKALSGSLEAQGKLTDLLSKPQIGKLTLRLRHPSYVELMRLIEPHFKSGVGIKKSLDLFASMTNEDGVYAFNEIKALIGPSTMTGDVRVDMTGAKPVIKARLQTDILPLDEFLGHSVASKGTTRVTPQAAAAESRWSQDVIDLTAFRDFDLDVQATAGSLTYGNWIVKNAKLDTLLTDGNLALQDLSGGIYGGQMAMKADVAIGKTAKDPLQTKGTIAIKDVQLEPLVQSFSGTKLIRAQGPVSVNVDFNAEGISQSALVNNLQGQGSLTGKDLLFEGFDLARLSQALADPTKSFTKNFSRLMDATTSGGSTQFDTMDTQFDIKNGIVDFTKMELAGPKAIVTGDGSVNLPLWTIDLTTNIKLTEPDDAPVLKTVFKGPLDNPGSTFGQNALNQYFNKQIEGLVVNPLINSLQKKGILPGVQQQQPAQQPAAEGATVDGSNGDGTTSGDGTTQQNVQQPAPANDNAQPQDVKPEDVLKGIIGGVLRGR